MEGWAFYLTPPPTEFAEGAVAYLTPGDLYGKTPLANALGPWVGTEDSDEASSGKSDGEQAPLVHLVQLVKANRWVQIGHTLSGIEEH